jgi:GAF domain-containing protein
MRRGPKPAKAKVEAKAPVTRNSPKSDGARVRDLEKRLAEALKREAEAQEQQAATAEILRVISNSPTGIHPVLDTVAESAARLCESFDSAIWRREGDRAVLVAHHGPIPMGPIGEFSLPLVRGTVAGRSLLDGRTIHVADLQTEVDEFPESSEYARRIGVRTILNVPLMRGNVPIGAIVLLRPDSQLFTERQVALLQAFADQAVIAIENVRLFTELETRNRDLREALDQQTATTEILRVISTSPTNLQPMLDAIATNAARVCGAYDATVVLQEGDLTRRVAHCGPIVTDYADLRPLRAGYVANRAILEGKPVHVDDILNTDRGDLSDAREAAPHTGNRTILAVPLLRAGDAIGALTIRRREVQPFTDKQVALLQTFADQAVIAIEDVRLFKELQEKNQALTIAHAQVSETLEQQTATSEILRTISRSPTDLQPVLDAIATSAARLLEAEDVGIIRVAGDVLRLVAGRGPVYTAWGPGTAIPLSRGSVSGRAVIDRTVMHIRDLAAVSREEYPVSLDLQRQAGVRTVVAAPLICEGTAIGLINVFRRQVRPFTEQQIELLKTFADQAVIAIENVRLFNETKEALDQQTATSEVLRVIASSPYLKALCRPAIVVVLCYARFFFDGRDSGQRRCL